MKLEEISHPWPPNIHRYEQKYLGIPVNAFMIGGVIGILAFVVISQGLAGFVGMIAGALMGIAAFIAAVLLTTPLTIFHHMRLPVYLLTRWQATRSQTTLRLPLIVSSDSSDSIEIYDWEGQQQGVLE